MYFWKGKIDVNNLENILKWMKEQNFQRMMFLNLIEHKNKLMNLFIILKIF